ncbi:hypothetical protein MBLNU457_5138t1 [Dothideomycetes sp. NU457]
MAQGVSKVIPGSRPVKAHVDQQPCEIPERSLSINKIWPVPDQLEQMLCNVKSALCAWWCHESDYSPYVPAKSAQEMSERRTKFLSMYPVSFDLWSGTKAATNREALSTASQLHPEVDWQDRG